MKKDSDVLMFNNNIIDIQHTGIGDEISKRKIFILIIILKDFWNLFLDLLSKVTANPVPLKEIE